MKTYIAITDVHAETRYIGTFDSLEEAVAAMRADWVPNRGGWVRELEDSEETNQYHYETL